MRNNYINLNILQNINGLCEAQPQPNEGIYLLLSYCLYLDFIESVPSCTYARAKKENKSKGVEKESEPSTNLIEKMNLHFTPSSFLRNILQDIAFTQYGK